MKTLEDIHQQFAGFFEDERIKPYAYLLSKRIQEGNICIPKEEPEQKITELPYPSVFPSQQLATLEQWITQNAETVRPFVLHKNKLYLHRYFHYESSILQSIQRLLSAEKEEQEKRLLLLDQHQNLICSLMANYPLGDVPEEEQPDWQLVAAVQAILNNFSIITGGPGTGKTTTVAKILAILFTSDPTCRVALAAPTGKAAMRMAESLKQTSLSLSKEVKEKFLLLQPGTIHRLLGTIHGSLYFKHHRNNPLPFDVVIADEASMIDVALFAKLLDAIGDHTRLILLGDKNQLASVEAGSMLGDLCKTQTQSNLVSEPRAERINRYITDPKIQIPASFIGNNRHPLNEHITELKRSHRFSGNSGIGRLSKAIIDNNEPELTKLLQQNSDPNIIFHFSEDIQVLETFAKNYREYIEEPSLPLALKKLNRVRVLCAVREGNRGLYYINQTIEKVLSKMGLINTNSEFYEHRPIIVTKNYPDLHLFNGDIGIIRKDEQGNIRAWFEDSEGQIRAVMPGYIAEAETVFAMTIHKSQGSEYNHVLILMPDQSDHQLLTRELLYTAVTRAKEKVIIQASEDTILQTCKRSVKRVSGIRDRFDEI